MDPRQILLIASSLVTAGGGVVMLSRAARSPGAAAARRPYVPLAITFIGLMVAYRAFSDFQTLEPMDLLILSLFIVALLSVLGMQFFIIDKHADDK